MLPVPRIHTSLRPGKVTLASQVSKASFFMQAGRQGASRTHATHNQDLAGGCRRNPADAGCSSTARGRRQVTSRPVPAAHGMMASPALLRPPTCSAGVTAGRGAEHQAGSCKNKTFCMKNLHSVRCLTCGGTWCGAGSASVAGRSWPPSARPAVQQGGGLKECGWARVPVRCRSRPWLAASSRAKTAAIIVCSTKAFQGHRLPRK